MLPLDSGVIVPDPADDIPQMSDYKRDIASALMHVSKANANRHPKRTRISIEGSCYRGRVTKAHDRKSF